MAVWSLLRETASRYSGHKASLLGAALAYYSVFSLGLLMVIAIAVAGLVFGDDAARGEVGTQLKDLLGNTGAQAVEAMLAGAGRRHNGVVAATIGVVTLVFAAIWVVVALKEALNTIWDVAAPPSSGIWSLARSYVASLVGVLALGFLLLMSLLATTVLAAGATYITQFMSEAPLHAMSFLLSFSIVSLLFAMMFKWLPDTDIAWSDVWLGALVTAALFEIGKVLIGLYIGKQALEFDLWSSLLDRGGADLGVLQRPDCSPGRRIHPGVCRAPRFEEVVQGGRTVTLLARWEAVAGDDAEPHLARAERNRHGRFAHFGQIAPQELDGWQPT